MRPTTRSGIVGPPTGFSDIWGTSGLLQGAPARAILAALVLLALIVLSAATTVAQPALPALSGRIVDEAGLLTAADRAEIEVMLRDLEGKSSDQVVVFTTPSLQGYEIEDFGVRLARAWRVGQAGTNNGIVLIVAPSERKVRIEVGRGLEGQMTDLMSGLIIRNGILPAFRRGDFSGGIKAGVRDIKDVLLGDAEAVRDRARSLQSRAPETDWTPLLIFALFLAFWLYVSWQAHRHARTQPTSAQRRRRFGDGNVIVVPGGWGGSGGWSGGSSGSGGGYSGGGGDFGGGGASGNW
jgi:uncharacterized protein